MTNLISHVEKAFENAFNNVSKINDEILDMDGMSGRKTRHFYNNICSMDDARYLEIGTWKGSSICSAMCGNNMKCVAIDNWSEFGGPREEFLVNFNKFKGQNDATFIEDNCWNVDVSKLIKFNIYMYDGNHTKDSHFQALNKFLPVLDDEFVYIVDDWNWEDVRNGTIQAIKDNHLTILYEKEIFTNNKAHPNFGPGIGDRAGKDGNWHNGIIVYVLKK